MSNELQRVEFVEYALITLAGRVSKVFDLSALAPLLLKAKFRLQSIDKDLKAKKIVKNPTLKYTWFLRHLGLLKKGLKKKPYTDALRVLENAGFVVLNERLEVVAIGPLVDVTRDILNSSPQLAKLVKLKDDFLLFHTILVYQRALCKREGFAISSTKLAKLSDCTESKSKAYLTSLVRKGLLTLVKGSKANVYRATPYLKKLYKELFENLKASSEKALAEKPLRDVRQVKEDSFALPLSASTELSMEVATDDCFGLFEKIVKKSKEDNDQAIARERYFRMSQQYGKQVDIFPFSFAEQQELFAILGFKSLNKGDVTNEVKARLFISRTLEGNNERLKAALIGLLKMEMSDSQGQKAGAS